MIIMQDAGQSCFYVTVAQTDTGYYVSLTVIDDSNSTHNTSAFALMDSANDIGIIYKVSDGGDNGSAELILNGTSKEELTSLDNDTKVPTFNLEIGNCNIASESGTIYIDKSGYNKETFLYSDPRAIAIISAHGSYMVLLYPPTIQFNALPVPSILMD